MAGKQDGITSGIGQQNINPGAPPPAMPNYGGQPQQASVQPAWGVQQQQTPAMPDYGGQIQQPWERPMQQPYNPAIGTSMPVGTITPIDGYKTPIVNREAINPLAPTDDYRPTLYESSGYDPLQANDMGAITPTDDYRPTTHEGGLYGQTSADGYGTPIGNREAINPLTSSSPSNNRKPNKASRTAKQRQVANEVRGNGGRGKRQKGNMRRPR
jgi:hypothetical protein